MQWEEYIDALSYWKVLLVPLRSWPNGKKCSNLVFRYFCEFCLPFRQQMGVFLFNAPHTKSKPPRYYQLNRLALQIFHQVTPIEWKLIETIQILFFPIRKIKSKPFLTIMHVSFFPLKSCFFVTLFQKCLRSIFHFLMNTDSIIRLHMRTRDKFDPSRF